MNRDTPHNSSQSTHPASSKLADLRKNYERAELVESLAAVRPLAQFQTWLQDALDAGSPEASAMTLATVGSNLRPSTRIVLLKGLDERGLVWFTNYQSRKGVELAGNPFAALQFHWVDQERTVRIEGRVEKIDDADSDTYFHSRPLASRIGAIVSPQSEVIANREVLDQATRKAESACGATPNRPAHWGGYRLVPDEWQFWQGRRSRLHDRLRYRLVGEVWVRDRLAP